VIVKRNHIPYHFILTSATSTYPIYIGKRLQNKYGDFLKKYPKIAIVTNTTIYKIYKNFLDHLSLKYPQVFHIVVGDGEKFKNITTLVNIFKQLMDNDLGRDGLIIAFGGGVVGDLAGFASAIYMRGIDYIQIPTTLLAMTDSSVGGKTGINLPHGKNIVGSFHQPQAVFCDLLFLDTLPVREFNAGLMEVIKYGLILDASLYDFIIQKKERIKKFDKNIIAYLIFRSGELKAKIVTQNEKDTGIRSILSFGHTIGHALESYSLKSTDNSPSFC
jgi:3-dehydroquinate synthase